MSSKTQIFVTGATGYLGGSVVSRLLEHPNASSFQITALVRSTEKAALLEPLGIKTVIGSFTELEKSKRLTSEADIIFSMADSDNLEVIQAMLRGIRQRHLATNTTPILIHTSGTAFVADFGAEGKFTYEKIHNDMAEAEIETLPVTAMHRNVDSEIVKADAEGYVKSYIIAPSTVYGCPTGKLVDVGAQHLYSKQVPFFIQAASKRGQTGIVGQGGNIWPNVANSELADLFIILFDSIATNPATAHGREGFYYGENDEYKHYDVLKRIAEVAFELGKGKSPEPTEFTAEDIKETPILPIYLGSHCRVRADRSRSIGWKPVQTTKDMIDSIKADVEALM